MATSRRGPKRGRKSISASKPSQKRDLNHIRRKLVELRREIRSSFQ